MPLTLAALARMSPQHETPSMPPAMTNTRSSVSIAAITGEIRCTVGTLPDLGPSCTVLARPTMRGQRHSGSNPTVAPGNERKSSASDTVVVSSLASRSRTEDDVMGGNACCGPATVVTGATSVNSFVRNLQIRQTYQRASTDEPSSVGALIGSPYQPASNKGIYEANSVPDSDATAQPAAPSTSEI